MQLKNVSLSDILTDSPEAEQFLFTYRPGLNELLESIERTGIVNPPRLLERISTQDYVVICGSRRIEAARQLGMREILALTVRNDQCTIGDCLKWSIADNRFWRGFNEIERAMLLTRLDEYPQEVRCDLERALGDELALPKHPHERSRYREILSLDAEVKNSLALGEITLGHALLLLQLPEQYRKHFFRWIVQCGLNTNEARQVLTWVTEVSRRELVDLSVYMAERRFEDILQSSNTPRNKAQRLLAVLRNERFPTIERWRRGFKRAASASGIQPWVELSYDHTFESMALSFTIKASSEQELSDKLAHLSQALQSGTITGLFTSVSSGPSS